MRFLAALASVIISLTAVAPLAAQTPSVTAEVDRSSVTTDDVITLSIHVEGGNQASRPQLPLLDGLVVMGSSSISQISSTNGRMVSSFLFEYRLAASRTGDLTIGPISVSVDGVQHLTRPIEIRVSAGTGTLSVPTPAPDFDFSPSPDTATLTGQDHFLEAGVDRDAPYLGEQVTYHRRYYRAREGVGLPSLFLRSYQPPSFGGFWHLDLSDEGRYEVDAAGRRYEVFEERTVLFPSLVGSVTIEPAVMSISEGLGRPSRVLTSGEININVRPLPAGAPPGFGGAVGDYSIQATVEAARLSGGDPARLTVTISGSGNIDALPAPDAPSSGDWRTFADGSDSSFQVLRGILRGSKSFEYTMLPNVDGALEIPPISFVFFDPGSESYVTVSTDPIAVEVEPGSIPRASAAGIQDPAGEGESTGPSVVDAPWELRPLAGPLQGRGTGFAGSGWYLALLTLPALLIVTFELVRHRGTLATALGRARRGRSAVLLDAAATDLSPGQRITAVLSARLGQPVAGWSSDRLAMELAGRGVSPDLVSEMFAVIELGEAGRFAPPGMRPDKVDAGPDVEEVVRRLESELE